MTKQEQADRSREIRQTIVRALDRSRTIGLTKDLDVAIVIRGALHDAGFKIVRASKITREN